MSRPQAPSAISGFPEYLPHHMAQWHHWIVTLSQHFQSHGYGAMDTPAVERMSTLLSKGDDAEIYAIHRWEDLAATQPHGEGHRDKNPHNTLGLRFDLTIPLARYITQHHGSLTFPFKRHHIGPVWRGERPQEGRYRQFYQCDIDVIGHNTLVGHYDHDIVVVLDQALEALGIESWSGPHVWHLNHRDILHSWAQWAGIDDASAALRCIDKYPKITWEALEQSLYQLGASPQSLACLCTWRTPPTDQSSPQDHIQSLSLPTESPSFQQAKDSLRQTVQWAIHRGVDPSRVRFAPLLARGLSYYSGLTFEATLPWHPSLGSIAGGGRYDHLASSLGSKDVHPGVGGSLGISRLFGSWCKDNAHSTMAMGDIFMTTQEPHLLSHYLSLAHQWRQEGWKVETCVESWPLAKQMKYAHKKGYPIVIMANQEDVASHQVVIKHMASGEQVITSLAQAPALITQWLAQLPSAP